MVKAAGARWLPSAPELARETLIVLGGALLAAFIIGQLPELRDWAKRQWGGVPQP